MTEPNQDRLELERRYAEEQRRALEEQRNSYRASFQPVRSFFPPQPEMTLHGPFPITDLARIAPRFQMNPTELLFYHTEAMLNRQTHFVIAHPTNAPNGRLADGGRRVELIVGNIEMPRNDRNDGLTYPRFIPSWQSLSADGRALERRDNRHSRPGLRVNEAHNAPLSPDHALSFIQTRQNARLYEIEERRRMAESQNHHASPRLPERPTVHPYTAVVLTPQGISNLRIAGRISVEEHDKLNELLRRENPSNSDPNCRCVAIFRTDGRRPQLEHAFSGHLRLDNYDSQHYRPDPRVRHSSEQYHFDRTSHISQGGNFSSTHYLRIHPDEEGRAHFGPIRFVYEQENRPFDFSLYLPPEHFRPWQENSTAPSPGIPLRETDLPLHLRGWNRSLERLVPNIGVPYDQRRSDVGPGVPPPPQMMCPETATASLTLPYDNQQHDATTGTPGISPVFPVKPAINIPRFT